MYYRLYFNISNMYICTAIYLPNYSKPNWKVSNSMQTYIYCLYIYIRNICVYILCTDIMLPYVWCSDTPTMDLRNLHNSLHWRHNDHDCVSNHQPHGCLLNRLLRRRSKKTSKLRVTGLFTGAGEFPAQRASYAKNVSVSCRHHVTRSMW